MVNVKYPLPNANGTANVNYIEQTIKNSNARYGLISLAN